MTFTSPGAENDLMTAYRWNTAQARNGAFEFLQNTINSHPMSRPREGQVMVFPR